MKYEEPGIFSPESLDAIETYYRAQGYVMLRGLLTEDEVGRIEHECVLSQRRVVSGDLPPRHGSTAFLDEASKAERFANYVEYVNEISPSVLKAVTHPALKSIMRRLLGQDCWLNDSHRFGVVYQDARPGRES